MKSRYFLINSFVDIVRRFHISSCKSWFWVEEVINSKYCTFVHLESHKVTYHVVSAIIEERAILGEQQYVFIIWRLVDLLIKII